ncbi:MAG TPA: VOC family protein [Marmoricola sp.]|nr:VOC family protein [Marmoricola sp.]
MEHAHAVLHCNLNTVDATAAESFYSRLGLRSRMTNRTDDTDARPMGLGSSTASFTTFLYDSRGPRSAPALELVEWLRPVTADRSAPAWTTTGIRGIGLRVSTLSGLSGLSGPTGTAWVQGIERPSRVEADVDDVVVEIVELAGPETSEDACLSHLRLAARDLQATAEWYAAIGFVDVSRSPERLSLLLPEDPTFSLEIEADPAAEHGDAVANTRGLFRIALAVEDVASAHAALEAQGLEVPAPVFIPMADTPTGGFTVLFLADPDGIVVELVDRPRSSVRRPAAPSALVEVGGPA